MVTTVQRQQLAEATPYLSKRDYSDLPQRWKYLENTLCTKKKLRGTHEIIIVEKFKSVAIGFNHFGKKRPVVLYREYYKDFKDLKVGDTIRGVLGKMYVHVRSPTVIFTDLYVASVCNTALSGLFHEYDTYVSNGSLKVRDFTSEINQIELVYGREILFAEFGAILIPEKLSKIFSFGGLNEKKEVYGMGSIKYGINGFGENRYACWTFHLDFNIYVEQILYAKCVRGHFQIVPKADKKRRLAINTGALVARMVERDFGGNDTVRMFSNIIFLNFNDILSLNPGTNPGNI
uniref:Uncharacterized protein n=1 Tax=Panagrolaimus superbus TaxID=310955 RepID=A0A914YAQ3_9BILA